MSPVPTKQKSLLLLEKQGSYDVRETDVPKPGPGELLVQIHATALNPVDWKIQTYGAFITEYPAVLGTDSAGIVAAVGEGVTNFAVGDKVLHQGYFENRKATFQQYTIVPAEITAKLPSNLTFDQAATVPLVLATAAFGLYSKKVEPPKRGGAGLVAPWDEGGNGKYAGQPILVIGGSSAVGQQVLSLAKLSGFSPIITTASLHNEAFVKSLGATHVIDRNAPLEESVRKITQSPINVVYDAISEASTQPDAYSVLAPGGTFILVLPPQIPEDKLDSTKSIVNVFGTAHDSEQKETALALYRNVTSLLETGSVKPNHVELIPNGLAGIPDALEKLKSGKVSATKLVARPQES